MCITTTWLPIEHGMVPIGVELMLHRKDGVVFVGKLTEDSEWGIGFDCVSYDDGWFGRIEHFDYWSMKPNIIAEKSDI